MNGFTLLSFRLFAAAGLFGFFAWQLRRQGLDVDSSVDALLVWLVGGLCALGLAAAVAAGFDQARLTRADAVAIVLNGLGLLGVLLDR